MLEREKNDEVELADEGQPSCTMVTAKPGEINAGEGMIPGLQIMGVFALCGALMTLSWGGVTSMLVMTAKMWVAKPTKKSLDARTKTETPSNRKISRRLKPARVSFRDERTGWEWPRRTVSVGRRVRRALARIMDKGQAGWRECIGHQESGAASLPRRSEEM